MAALKAEILSVGTELLLGQIVNTNAAFLAARLAEVGVDLYRQTTVGDNLERVTAAFKDALERADLVLSTGGLGPTQDDLSRDALAAALGVPLLRHPEAEEMVRAVFSRRGLPLTEVQFRQAQVPEGGRPLTNPAGTAPGILWEGRREGRWDGRSKAVILLPGPPTEMQVIFETAVGPWLRDRMGGWVIRSRVLRLCGMGEPMVEAAVLDLIHEGKNPTIAPLVEDGEVRLRLTAKADAEPAANEMLDRLEAAIRARLDDHIFGVDDMSLPAAVVRLLTDKGLTLAVAESCTGGLLASRVTDIPGSSACFLWGATVYSNESKTALAGVSPATLEVHGAVSEETARELAEGVRRRAGSTFGIGVTGIAGPGGGTPEKPVGLVHFALAGPWGTHHQRLMFNGPRAYIRRRAAWQALVMLWQEARTPGARGGRS